MSCGGNDRDGCAVPHPRVAGHEPSRRQRCSLEGTGYGWGGASTISIQGSIRNVANGSLAEQERTPIGG